MAIEHNIAFDQGATWRWEFDYGPLLVDVNGDPVLDAGGNVQIDTGATQYDLTGATAQMQVRAGYADDAGTYPKLMEATTENGGITLSNDGTTGIAHIAIVFTATQTDGLRDIDGTPAGTPIKRGRYDLEITYPSGDVDRAVQGKWTNDPNVTRTEP